MNSTLELYEMNPFWTLDFHSQMGFSIFIFVILGFGVIIQKQLISFLKYKSNRPVNKIIYKNLIFQNLFIPPQLCYCLIMIWIHNPSRYISKYGCYGFLYAGHFIVHHERAHSLFVNLFRYICIVKQEDLQKNNIQPKVGGHSNFIFKNIMYNCTITTPCKVNFCIGCCLVDYFFTIHSKHYIYSVKC